MDLFFMVHLQGFRTRSSPLPFGTLHPSERTARRFLRKSAKNLSVFCQKASSLIYVVFILFFRFVLVFGYLFRRNGVIPSRKERIAAKYTPYRQKKSHKKASFHKRLCGVGRTGRCKPTSRTPFKRGQKFLIQPYQPYANVLHFSSVFGGISANIPNSENALKSSSSMSKLFFPTIAPLALITIR